MEIDETQVIKKYLKQMMYEEDIRNFPMKISCIMVDEVDRNNSLFKGNFKLEHIKTKVEILRELSNKSVWGRCNSKGILVYVDNTINSYIKYVRGKKMINEVCTEIRSSIYHEMRHYIQRTGNANSFSSIMYYIEKVVRYSKKGREEYRKNHDKFYVEIDADLYSANKVVEHYENNKDDDTLSKKIIKELTYSSSYNNYTYDFDKMFNLFCEVKRVISKISHRTNNWEEVFFDGNGQLKDIEAILDNKNLNNVNNRLKNYILTSRLLDSMIDYTALDDIKKQIMLNNYKIRIKHTRKNIENIISNEEYRRRNIFNMEDLERLNNSLNFYLERKEYLTYLLNSKGVRR